MSRNKVEFSEIQALVESLRFEFVIVPNSQITGCWGILPSGFKVGYGESGCVDPANFNKELGEKYAKERCIVDSTNELWKLEGYVLSKELAK